jgi:arabinose-5-phosphate isomerase
MTTHAQAAQVDLRLEQARQVLRTEAAALYAVADRLGPSFLAAVDAIFRCTGRVCLTGTGKSADVAQKIAGTFNSTGTRAYLLDPTRAVHGDLGMVGPDDVVLVLSHSGESEEVVRILRPLRQLASGLIALTSNPNGTLAREADIAIVLGPLTEADPLGLAPSTSTTAMIAVGDALAFVLSRQRAFNHDDFARFHPAGSLGRKLMKVEAVMRRGSELRIAAATKSIREVFAQSVGRLRRSGAVMLVDEQGKLIGLFTDSDLARLFEQRRDHLLDEPISRVMTQRPLTIRVGSRLLDALDILRTRKISELPVVDDDHRPIGLIDITDVLGLLPDGSELEEPRAAA